MFELLISAMADLTTNPQLLNVEWQSSDKRHFCISANSIHTLRFKWVNDCQPNKKRLLWFSLQTGSLSTLQQFLLWLLFGFLELLPHPDTTSHCILLCYPIIRNKTSFQNKKKLSKIDCTCILKSLYLNHFGPFKYDLIGQCHLRGTGGTKLWLKQWDTNRSCWILTD